ncbi:exonuclease [Rhizobium phage vB_RleA_TRX32-1]|uniref:Exonuclease n=1 Tax=Rhizobium phage vB_RleA_TRX32-1 TaxID=2777321 RepID=A0A7T7GS86_9CAUD|nr:exonuclease [Rhizobium phage vB_RleA_TRX32-1]
MTRTLLIDADVVAYVAASSLEVATDWGDGYWTWHVDEFEVQKKVKQIIDDTMEDLKGDSCKLCLTDSLGNFRKSVLATYKGNRSNIKKPLVLMKTKQWMIDELGAYFRPGLEGDDCMGILATMKGTDERIIVSIDKDMKTVPGKFCRYTDSKAKIVEYSEKEADYWHLYQTLMGDATDGYPGCPGIGPKKAEAILGPIDEFDLAEGWARVLAAFEKAKLTETDALTQARVARILRACDYDFKKKEPILWQPKAN